MSSFICEHCGASIIDDGTKGFITGCEHYPIETFSDKDHTSNDVVDLLLFKLEREKRIVDCSHRCRDNAWNEALEYSRLLPRCMAIKLIQQIMVDYDVGKDDL